MKTTALRFADLSNKKMKRPHGNRLEPLDRAGYTLLEILVSVTLMLVLMFCVAKIFSRVGSVINDTQRTMELANNIRNVRNRLEDDLTSLTAPLTPPLNSSDNQGYFCYMEGLGAPLQRVLQDNGIHTTEEIALDSDRSAGDSTVGDLDDILMFTAQAPAGNYFRGRFGGKMIESEFAEIIWFVRGSTLYRRVLLIIPNQLLQQRFSDQEFLDIVESNDTPRTGQAFFKYFDVSVHLDKNGFIEANTLGDLSNRKNRYGYWASYFGSNSGNISGTNAAWYWLRLPTLWESASHNFQAGKPMGNNFSYSYDGNNNLIESLVTNWLGINLNTGGNNAANLPITEPPSPFIDYWTNPNCWDEINKETGNLDIATLFNSTLPPEGLNQDVIMTNVLSFNVRAWNSDLDVSNQNYIDLGVNERTLGISDQNYLSFQGNASTGYYGDPNGEADPDRPRPYAPCIYDTWTEQYQIESLQAGFSDKYSINDIPLNGNIDAAVLDLFPPPYNVPLKGLQVEIRAFDPRSKTIKNITLEVEFPQ